MKKAIIVIAIVLLAGIAQAASAQEVNWNQSWLNLGSVYPGNTIFGPATVLSNGTNTNVFLLEHSNPGNGQDIIDDNASGSNQWFFIGNMADGQTYDLLFSCSPPINWPQGGYYSMYHVNSTEDPAGDFLNISCTVLQSSNNTTNNPPSMTVLAPNGGEVLSGIVDINWTASDPDGDALLIDLGYLKYGFPIQDNVTIAVNEVNDGNYKWNTSGLCGSFKVWGRAKDASLSDYDESDDWFNITTACAQPPVPTCVTPSGRMTLYQNTTFCPGTYNNVSVSFGASNIGLTCNNTVLVGPGSGYAVNIVSRHNIRVENCTIRGYLYAIRTYYSNYDTFKGNYLLSNSQGFNIYRSIYNMLDNNTLSKNIVGANLLYSNSNTIKKNLIYNNTRGMSLYYSNLNNVLQNNLPFNQYSGIQLYYSNSNSLSGNTASAHAQPAIILNRANSNRILGNTLNNNKYGLTVYFSNSNIISQNTMCFNTHYDLRCVYSTQFGTGNRANNVQCSGVSYSAC